jgi:hypothetical protein
MSEYIEMPGYRCAIDANDAEWMRIRKEEGTRIDPDTALVTFFYEHGYVPFYAKHYEEGYKCEHNVGRVDYAIAPDGSTGWVSFDDLPDHVCEALEQRRSKHLQMFVANGRLYNGPLSYGTGIFGPAGELSAEEWKPIHEAMPR